nr:DUF4932 domain-containing protein [Armatimonadota bacterium]NIM24127.1 DUF4932 domain-containing protein [Armatimonadota bacterium]NIM67982.1 DUF4932 domain-containing protein [Armatimonadota bacterium]NIM76486.1 DUF4932 domain-containing protein [Armatimonadota bacterium]NIN06209.1 DUF4932 domain-containing protein [Armatimonadota bacterium]
ATGRMKEMLSKETHLGWFEEFFGARPDATFHVTLGMLNGGCCYGPRIKLGDREELYSILGVWMTDADGIPEFDETVITTLVHEFGHSYTNRIVEKYLKDLEPAGEVLFLRVKDAMKRQAYGQWETMMRESVLRACVVRYIAATEGAKAAKKQIQQEHKRQFLWTGELSEMLVEYDKNRDKYPTLDAFFPKIVTFFDEYVAALPYDPFSELPPNYTARFLKEISPDGRYLSFTGYRAPEDAQSPEDYEPGLWVYDLETKKVKKLLSGWLQTPFDWSADSRKIAISNGEGYTLNHSLAVIDVETGEVTDLGVDGVGPAFSPDGKQLAYTAEYDKNTGSWFNGVPWTGRIAVMDIAPVALPKPISSPGEGAVLPCWSPDGTRVAYQIQTPNYSLGREQPSTKYTVLFVAQADGAGVKEVYSADIGGSGFETSWEPSGKELRISSEEGNIIVAADGSDSTFAAIKPGTALPPEVINEVLARNAATMKEQILFSHSFTPYADALLPDRFAVTFENPTDLEMKAEVRWEKPSKGWEIQPRKTALQIPAKGKQMVDFKMQLDDHRRLAGGLPNLLVEIPLQETKKPLRIRKDFADLAEITIPCARANAPLKIDGDLSDWKGTRPVWSSYSRAPKGWESKDISAAVRMMWDDDWLYFGAEVWDDILTSPESVEDLWQGDSVSMMVSGFECTFALIKGESLAIRNLEGGSENSPMADVRVKVSRKEGCTIYEAALPISKVFEKPPEQGEVVPTRGTGTYWNDKDGEESTDSAWQTCRIEFR